MSAPSKAIDPARVGRGRWLRPSAASTLDERMRGRIGQPNDGGCWPWLGAASRAGYGTIQTGRRTTNGTPMPELAHRVVYRTLRESIPDDLTIDHLCRNRMCVNPEHMEVVTRAENSRRGAIKTICKRGHVLAESAVPTPSGYRTCKPCRDFRNARRFAR